MTKSGSDHLKRHARDLARATGRRYPDVLAEFRRDRPVSEPSRTPSKELVRLCGGPAHDYDESADPFLSRPCARPFGHRDTDRGWGSGCSTDPHHHSDIRRGHLDARAQAEAARHEAWLAGLSPAERETYEQESEADYQAQADAYDFEPGGFYNDYDEDNEPPYHHHEPGGQPEEHDDPYDYGPGEDPDGYDDDYDDDWDREER